MGRFQEACDDIERLVREADPGQLQGLQESQGLNYEVLARTWQSHALWCLGRPAAAHRVRLSRPEPRPRSSGSRSTRRSPPPTWRCSSSCAPTPPRSAHRRQRRSRSPPSSRRPTTGPGPPSWSPTRRRSTQRTRRRSRVCGPRSRPSRRRGRGCGCRTTSALLADGHLRAGDATAGLELVEEGLARGRETNERWWDAELHRLRAELLLASGAEPAEAEAALRRALEIARGQQARSLELRAAPGPWPGCGRTRAGPRRPGSCSRPCTPLHRGPRDAGPRGGRRAALAPRSGPRGVTLRLTPG